jgi:hypothetical protein
MKGDSFHYDVLLAQLTEEYGVRLGSFLANRFAKAIKRTGDLCIDNLRVADADNPEEMARYEKAKESGCCGFHDQKLTFRSFDSPPKQYWIGFNYGH